MAQRWFYSRIDILRLTTGGEWNFFRNWLSSLHSIDQAISSKLDLLFLQLTVKTQLPTTWELELIEARELATFAVQSNCRDQAQKFSSGWPWHPSRRRTYLTILLPDSHLLHKIWRLPSRLPEHAKRFWCSASRFQSVVSVKETIKVQYKWRIST